MSGQDGLLDYAGLAAKLRIPETWLRRHIRQLPHQKYGQYVRFGPEDVALIQADHQVRPGAAVLPSTAPALLELRPGRAPRGRRAA
jgi:hypothetical protein